MTFRDIEDSIRMFDGKGHLPIEAWVEEFEETAALVNWDEFKIFVFAKISLSCIEKLFIQSARGITSWRRLKEGLIEEFRTATNRAQLHKKLTERIFSSHEGNCVSR